MVYLAVSVGGQDVFMSALSLCKKASFSSCALLTFSLFCTYALILHPLLLNAQGRLNCSDGSMTLFSLQDGGVLGEYQEAVLAGQTVAAAAFSPDNKALCAVAYAGSCVIVTSPWRQKPCAVKGCYVCPEVMSAGCCHNNSKLACMSAKLQLVLENMAAQDVLLAIQPGHLILIQGLWCT